MAKAFKPCSVDGCNGNAHSSANGCRGWCKSHYAKWWRYGDPEAGGTQQGDLPRWLHEVAIPYTGEDCLIWPYSRNTRGYGQIKHNGQTKAVHRLICETVKGSPPSDHHQAAHSCGNGHLGCVNPKHLSWKTPKENQADRIEHGTVLTGEDNPFSKLTEEDVSQIRQLATTKSQASLAEEYGVTQYCIWSIIHRHTWQHLP